MISENQSGFIAKRQSIDNIILVQEAIHTNSTYNIKGMAIKFGMASNFDKFGHDFLLRVLEKFGFNSLFVLWIKTCISSPWITPLGNGIST